MFGREKILKGLFFLWQIARCVSMPQSKEQVENTPTTVRNAILSN